MNEFNKLRELVSSLTAIEIKFLKKSFGHLISTGTNSQLLMLLKIILKDSSISHIWVVNKIYGYENKTAFKKLCQRLIEKIMDCLISKDLLSNDIIHSERNRELFQIKRRFLYYDILSIHGLNSLALSNLNHIIKSCKDSENFDYLLIALNIKLVRLSRRSGIKHFTLINKEIEFYTRCSLSLNKANFLLAYYTSLKNSGELEFKNYNLNDEIISLEREVKLTGSIRLKSALFYLKGINYSSKGQYIQAKSNFYSFYAHLKKSSIKINRSNDKLNCLLNIIEFEIKTFEFKKALIYFNEIDKLKVINKFNLDIINEMKFLCHLSLGDVNKAFDFLELLVEENNDFDSTLLMNDRIVYYKSIIYFIKGEYHKSVSCLTVISNIDKKFADWNLCQRFMIIIGLIELEKFSLVENHIDNLRKYLDGKGINSSLRKEFLLILKILNNLSRNGYNFKITATLLKNTLETIGTLQPNLYFDFRSPKLIPFTPWFNSKLKNVPYDHSAAMKEMRRNYKAEKMETV